MGKLPYITVAAVDSKIEKIDDIDFICTGKNDEIIINKAIDEAVKQSKIVYLLNGKYYIDDFYDWDDGGPKSAIRFPITRIQNTMIGQTYPYGKNDFGVTFYVSASALDKVKDEEYDVIRTGWTAKGIINGSVLKIENVQIVLSHNQTPIRCVDLRRCDRVELKNVRAVGYGDIKAGFGAPPPVPVKGCIGFTMTDGSNNYIVRYDNVSASGLYEGIQVGGEHVVMVNCAAIMNFYGYTFGNYGFNCGCNHPITMINCLDERNVNLPLFNECGDHDKQGNIIRGRQEVSMISFNIERMAHQTPGGKLGDVMREVHPGSYCGRIDFTWQPDWNAINSVDCQIWETDGSGKGFRTTNLTHKTVCTSVERLSYGPTLGQQVFDTDLNKLLTCIDIKAKKWVDANGVNYDGIE